MKRLIEKALDNLISYGTIEYCSEYGERGYTVDDDKEGILFADWNPFYKKYPNLMDALERHFMLEWSDEWVFDYNNDKAYRCVGDSYGWQQQFRYTDCGDIITPDDDAEVWIDECKVDSRTYEHTRTALPSFITREQIEAQGFELIDDDLQNGWYHREDDPVEKSKALFEQGYDEVVFSLTGVEQFAINFAVYAKRLEPNFEDWLACELFDYLVENYLISGEEEFEDWKNMRDTMIKMCKETLE